MLFKMYHVVFYNMKKNYNAQVQKLFILGEVIKYKRWDIYM